MKSKMKIKYRKVWLFAAGVAFLLILFAIMIFAFSFVDKNWVLGVLCSLLVIVVLGCTWVLFNYGITINEKHIVAIAQSNSKVLRYDDVSSIVIKFTNEDVVAYIKMKKGQEHTFVWDNIFLGVNLVLPSENKIKLNDKFVKESIESLSRCPKVKIQNFYSFKSDKGNKK